MAFEPESDLKGDEGSSDEPDAQGDIAVERARPERPRGTGILLNLVSDLPRRLSNQVCKFQGVASKDKNGRKAP